MFWLAALGFSVVLGRPWSESLLFASAAHVGAVYLSCLSVTGLQMLGSFTKRRHEERIHPVDLLAHPLARSMDGRSVATG